MQEGVEAPIHVMLQPDYLTARVAALEDLEIYVEDLAFTRILCEETKAVKREKPMKVPIQGPLYLSCPCKRETRASVLDRVISSLLRLAVPASTLQAARLRECSATGAATPVTLKTDSFCCMKSCICLPV